MAAMARASHPALYELAGIRPRLRRRRAAVAATRCSAARGTTRWRSRWCARAGCGGFGSDGKSLQVGLAAASGVDAARLAAAGARMPLERAAAGFEQATGGRYAEEDGEGEAGGRSASRTTGSRRGRAACRRTARSRPPPGSTGRRRRRWSSRSTRCRCRRRGRGQSRPTASGEVLDPVPDRLHAAARAADGGELRPRGRRGGGAGAVDRGAHGRVVARVRDRAGGDGGEELVRVEAALGSPRQPMDAAALRAKVERLAGPELASALDGPEGPAVEVLGLAGITSPYHVYAPSGTGPSPPPPPPPPLLPLPPFLPFPPLPLLLSFSLSLPPPPIPPPRSPSPSPPLLPLPPSPPPPSPPVRRLLWRSLRCVSKIALGLACVAAAGGLSHWGGRASPTRASLTTPAPLGSTRAGP